MLATVDVATPAPEHGALGGGGGGGGALGARRHHLPYGGRCRAEIDRWGSGAPPPAGTDPACRMCGRLRSTHTYAGPTKGHLCPVKFNSGRWARPSPKKRKRAIAEKKMRCPQACRAFI